ncbi:MAG: LysM peptidoglycan-binding domain-containing protein [Lachnospiraceae bacterium]|nr:LysM peptidoglycan-binding domain-containing protein [Lachnospiraceae bacterium]
MEASDILIHKGEKEEKYQLYVEDYVMSYLKNYRITDRRIFFYGERKPREKKYYIYGAGRQKQISYFEKYELLDEITCRYVMDMPVFSVRENSGTYELKGYYIFYQSNDAMQSYMVEQRKNVESKEKAEEKSERPIAVVNRRDNNELSKSGNPVRNRLKEKSQNKSDNGLMAIQLSAIFIIIAAITINSTNSYTKLKELGRSAVEVFFVLENQDAAENGEGVAVVDETPNETVLRLTDLDEKFEEENNTAKLEEGNDADKSEAEGQESENAETVDTSSDVKETATNEILSSDQAFSRNIKEYYRIEKGDTLYTISIKIYGDSSKVAEICELNQIKNPDHIEYGQRILLP